MTDGRPVLPIEATLPALRAALAESRCAVLVAPPGAGKTTRVPLALLDAPWLGSQKIIMLEPRRLATRAAATFMASSLGERVGQRVGYRMRQESRVSAATRIEVVTEGILTRMLQHDPTLEGVGAVLFDEFHERSLIADTGLALTLAASDLFRDDLRLLVMSATLDGAAVARLLGDAPLLESEGRAFPVETRHVPPRTGVRLEAHVAQVVREALDTESGSVLVFLPGAGEIRRVEGILRSATLPPDVSVHPLYGMLTGGAQDAAIAPAPAGRRKVVLATSIAETSLTIEGIRVVIDAGLMRIPRFSPRTGMTRLETVRVSRASADQRRGRAGRLMPGVCLRCWSAAEEAGLVPQTRAEILDSDLAPLALDLASAGFADPAALRWLDPPPAAAFAQGRDLLTLLGALDPAGALTPHGEAMASLGTHPRLAHLLITARAANAATLARAITLVALLDDRDPLRGAMGPPPTDLSLRLDLPTRDARDGAGSLGATVDRAVLEAMRASAATWRQRMGAAATERGVAWSDGMLLALAYPERVARQRGGPGRFLLRNGRGATVPITDPLAHVEWLAIATIEDVGRDGQVRMAAALDLEELLEHAGEQVEVIDEVVWDDADDAVSARRQHRLGALVLREQPLATPDPEAIRHALLAAIAARGVEALPWSVGARQLRERLQFLHLLDARWPDMGDAALTATLDAWLGPKLTGVRKLEAIARIDLTGALLDRLDWEQRRQLDLLAPEHVEVPTGSRIRVDYGDPAAPVLAVRLQEVFGMRETPRIGGGAVPLTMHLLSPAHRPMQVTRDLASFWATGYFDVRKDLRGRYPKHHWPDDPLTAAPVRGATRRG
jgi:ATP-dependent helicase HrpB